MDQGDGDEEYFLVDEFINHRIYKRRRPADQAQFWVKWRGYGTKDNSWVSVSSLRQDMESDLYAKAVQHYIARSGVALDKRWF